MKKYLMGIGALMVIGLLIFYFLPCTVNNNLSASKSTKFALSHPSVQPKQNPARISGGSLVKDESGTMLSQPRKSISSAANLSCCTSVTRSSNDADTSRPITADGLRKWIFKKNRTIFNGKTLLQHHQELEVESVDEQWSDAMEDRLNKFLTSSSETAQFNIDSVMCKTTQCEILLDTNRSASELHSQQLSKLLAAMKSESWWDFSSSYASEGDDATFIVFLQRKQRL